MHYQYLRAELELGKVTCKRTKNLQTQMKKILNKMLDNKCKDPITVDDEIFFAVDAPPPSQPFRYPFTSCPDTHLCVGGTGTGAPSIPIPQMPGGCTMILAGGVVIIGNLLEDVATADVGIADDPVTITGAHC
jgi:hypothetical protein